MEVIILYKLIKINAQHLESNADMRPECEACVDPHDVLAVLVVLIPQSLQDFNFNFTLLMQFLPIFKDLDGDVLLGLVIKASEHHTECTSSEFFLDLIPIENLIFSLIEVVSLIIVKAMVVRWSDIFLWIFILTCHLTFDVLANPLILRVEVKVVNHIIVTDLISLILTEMLTIMLKHVVRCHWELCWAASSILLSYELLLLGVLAS